MLEQFGRARGIAELVQHRGQQAATAEVVRVARDQRLEVAARLLVLASGVMGESADHQQLLAAREPFRRQRVDQRRRVGKQTRGTRRIPLAFGEQGEQVGGPRLRRSLLETLQYRARLLRTAEIDEDPRTRDRSIEQPRIEFLGAAVVGQRGIELAGRVRDRGARVVGTRVLRPEAHGLLRKFAREHALSHGDEYGDFGNERDGGRRIECTRQGEALARIGDAAEHLVSLATQHQQLDTHSDRQVVGRRDTQHILGLAAHQQDLRQRHHHLGGRDPEPLRLGKGHLGGTEFTTA